MRVYSAGQKAGEGIEGADEADSEEPPPAQGHQVAGGPVLRRGHNHEHLSYQMPQKPFEIFEEDFRKTAMDYLMFQQGIDAKEFGEKLLDTAMYSSRVSADNESVTVTMRKGGGGDGED